MREARRIGEEAVVAKAGWCDIEQTWVWVNEDGGDANGHDASHISKVYEADAKPAGSSEFEAQAGKVADDVGQGLEEAGKQLGDFAQQAWAWGKKQANSEGPKSE